MSKVTTFLQLITKDRTRLRQAIDHNFARTKISHLVPDKAFLKMRYRMLFSKKLNLHNPTTFNEKLQWLKLYNRQPNHINMVDKYNVKSLVSKIIGDEYIIPTIAVYDKVEDIDFASLPNKFVLKCTHDSGGIVICKDKSKFNIDAAEKKINKCIRKNYYYYGREWPYKNIKPKIICEEYLVDESGYELKDYKFFCFNGEPKLFFIASNRGIDTRFDFFDLEFNHLPIVQHYKNATKPLKRPPGLEKMIYLSRELSKGFTHVRIDFYDINGRIYFGEMTFYHFSGFEKFLPEEYDIILGSWIELPKISK